jgi:spore germination protein YaaH
MAAGMGLGILTANKYYMNISPKEEVISKPKLGQPEVSGWIAWWKEEQAYGLAASQSAKIKSVSPVWWRVNDELEIEKVGKADFGQTAAKMKSLGIRIYPSLGSELTGDKLSPLFSDEQKSDQLIASLITQISGVEVDGLDIDLEGIAESDRESFVVFLEKLKKICVNQKWKLSVTIQAQDGKNFWFGAKGQDIKKIGGIADEVRIMAYDRHSASGDAGPIAPLNWIKDVAEYNSDLISREKIVMGVPSYGYIWPDEGDPKGWQWDEFWKFLENKEYSVNRDEESGELIVTGTDFTGWLSDGEAMAKKINQYRLLGLNRFAIWHLGGLDEAIFGKFWPQN